VKQKSKKLTTRWGIREEPSHRFVPKGGGQLSKSVLYSNAKKEKKGFGLINWWSLIESIGRREQEFRIAVPGGGGEKGTKGGLGGDRNKQNRKILVNAEELPQTAPITHDIEGNLPKSYPWI